MSVKIKRWDFGKLIALATMAAGAASLARWYIRPTGPWRATDETSIVPPHTPNLLRTFLPQVEFSGEVAVDIRAAPDTIYDAMQRVTVDDMPVAKLMGTLRYLPAQLAHRRQTHTTPKLIEPFLQQLQTEGDNILLAARPGEEYVMGAIGKFHCLRDQQFVELRAPHEFVAFDHPDYQKLAMSFKITPLPGGKGNRLSLTHGTHALSPASRWKFALYWLAIKPGGNFVSWLMLLAIKSIAETSAVAATLVRA